MFGDSLLQVNIQLNQPMMHFLREPLVLPHTSTSGNLGHPLSAVSSCGWLLTIAAGQQTGWLEEVFLTRTVVCYVIRRKRTSNTFSLGVCVWGKVILFIRANPRRVAI
jgi:hypothetical protein